MHCTQSSIKGHDLIDSNVKTVKLLDKKQIWFTRFVPDQPFWSMMVMMMMMMIIYELLWATSSVSDGVGRDYPPVPTSFTQYWSSDDDDDRDDKDNDLSQALWELFSWRNAIGVRSWLSNLVFCKLYFGCIPKMWLLSKVTKISVITFWHSARSVLDWLITALAATSFSDDPRCNFFYIVLFCLDTESLRCVVGVLLEDIQNIQNQHLYIRLVHCWCTDKKWQ